MANRENHYEAAFEAGHIADAVWVDLDHQLAVGDRPATEGRHPLPTPAAFAEAMGSLGIANDTVRVLDPDTGDECARAVLDANGRVSNLEAAAAMGEEVAAKLLANGARKYTKLIGND